MKSFWVFQVFKFEHPDRLCGRVTFTLSKLHTLTTTFKNLGGADSLLRSARVV